MPYSCISLRNTLTIEKDYVLIIAVMHCHREPGYWHHRVSNKA